MKIVIAGPIPRDTILTHRGDTITNYGCITHPAIALARLRAEGLRIVPIAHIRQKDKAAILDILAPYDNIDLGGIRDRHDRGDIILLRYLDQNRREETQLGMMQPIVPADVADWLDADSFVFVPVTDFEISLDTLAYIKRYGKGPIIFDAHGPTVGVSSKGQRFHKLWADMDSWLPYIDVLKMNLEESRYCLVQPEYSLEEISQGLPLSEAHLPELAEHCLGKGLKALVITADAAGCHIFQHDAGGRVQRQTVPSIWMEQVVDTTGCGDTFAGGLAYGLLRHPGDYAAAARYANALAARRTQGKSFDVFWDLADTEALIAEHYR